MKRRFFWLAFIILFVAGLLVLMAGELALVSSLELAGLAPVRLMVSGWPLIFLASALLGLSLLGASALVLLTRRWLRSQADQTRSLDSSLMEAQAVLEQGRQIPGDAVQGLSGVSLPAGQLLDLMTDAINLVDRQMRLVLVNRAYEQMLAENGIHDSPLGKNLFELLPFLGERVRREYEQVFESGEALISGEWNEVDERRVYTETLKIPMREGGQVVQVLTLVRDMTRYKQLEEELRSLSTQLEQRVADRTGQMEDANQRLQETVLELQTTRIALERWTWQLQALFEISVEINRGASLQHLLTLVLEKTCLFWEHPFAGTFLLRQDAPMLELVAFINPSGIEVEPPQQIGQDQGLVGLAVRTGQVQQVPDLKHWQGPAPLMKPPLAQRVVAIPLRAAEQTLGALVLADSMPGEIDPQDLAVLSLFSDLAAIAVERDRQSRLDSGLREFAMRLAEVDQMEEALDLCLEAAVRYTGLDSGLIYTVDENTGAFFLVSHRGMQPAFIEAVRTVGPEKWRYQLALIGESFYISNEILQTWNFMPASEEGLLSVAVTPIFYQGRLVASFNMGSHVFEEIPTHSRAVLNEIAAELSNVIGRLKTEQQLRLSEATARTLLNTTREGAILMDREGRILAINDAAARAFATTAEAMVGHAVYDFMPPEVIQMRRPLIEDALRPDAPLIITTDQESDNRIVEHYFYPIRDDNNEPVGVAVFTHDITALREHAVILEQANIRLQELDRLKSRFLASVSHELRTPLNSIIGFTEVLMDGLLGEVNPQQAESLDNIWNSAQFLLALINDLLDFVKISTQQMDLNMERFSVSALFVALHNIFLPITAAKSQTLTFETVVPSLSLSADRLRVKQVLINLLSNAHKFTPPGGNIHVSASALPGGEMRFCVADDGIGIRPEDQEFIFEEFRQAPGVENSSEIGVGLGLAISRRLVELHGGRIWVESQPGQGSHFYFTLPDGELL